jgi:hypothetical protein
MRWTSEVSAAVGLSLVSFVGILSSCTNGNSGPSSAPMDSTGQSTASVEWVSFHTEVPFAAGDFHALASGLFGADAQAGKLITQRTVSPGITLGAAVDPSTPDQTQLTLAFDDGTPEGRTLAVVPASFAVGNIFLAATDAALAKMQADNAKQPGGGESFLLQYQVTSTQGGTFSFGVHGASGVYTLVLDVGSPTTNLALGSIGKPAYKGDPYDAINGTVWFHLTQDDFDYFVGHAYGKDQTAAQNFNDFALEPFSWLRLTVTPHLDQQYVNVAFDVLGTDGSRTPFAKAPASILAGGVFQSLVDRNMTTMTAQEKAKAGSSTPWTVPFYYDAPVDGGVVQVIAQGQTGIFQIAYAVQSPRHTLRDVPFLPYKAVDVMPPPQGTTTSCDQLGNPGIVASDSGAFSITFSASDQVLKSPDLKGPLVGNILCSVFHAADVTVTGPTMGAVSLQDFSLAKANLGGSAPPTFLTSVFPKGEYQILCFQDLMGDGAPHKGDPVTLPIGSFPIACNLNPVTVQFALLDPQN